MQLGDRGKMEHSHFYVVYVAGLVYESLWERVKKENPSTLNHLTLLTSLAVLFVTCGREGI